MTFFPCKFRIFFLKIFIIFLFSNFNTAAFSSEEEALDDFVIGYSNWPESLDPQYKRHEIALNTAYHLYDSLFLIDDKGEYYSEILESYETKNENTWIFKLKPNIQFHDGSYLTTKDIIYTFDRISNNKPTAFKDFINRFKSYSSTDDLTLTITTHLPHPTIMRDLYRLPIMKYSKSFSNVDNFLESKAYIGTGPYMLNEITPEGHIKLKRNPYYHEGKPYLKYIKFVESSHSNGSRIEDIKRGKIHLQDKIHSTEKSQAKNIDDLKIIERLSHRLVFLIMDHHSITSKYATDKNGKALKENPFKKLKVRKAISYAINRNELVNQVLDNNGKVSGQLVLDDVAGYSPILKIDEWNTDKAKQLLSEAGYPDGFKLMILATDGMTGWSDVNNFLVEQLKKINIDAQLDMTEKNEYYNKVGKHEFALALDSVSTRGDVKGMVNVILHTPGETMGKFNDGRYSNKEVDILINQGNSDFNEIRRTNAYKIATEIAISDMAIIPLFFEGQTWIINSQMGVEFWPYRNGYTLSRNIRKTLDPSK